MISEESDVATVHRMGNAFAFACIQCEAVVVGVNRNATVVAHRVLGERGVEAACFG